MKTPKFPGGMGNMGNLNQLMQQAQEAMKQAQQMEETLAKERFETSAGGGMVKAVFSGTGEIQSIAINPEVIDPEDVEMLQDLILSVVREGHQKCGALRESKMSELTGGLPNIPGLNLPF